MRKLRAPLSSHRAIESVPATMPSSVLKAMQIEFELAITAYLSSASYGEGEIYLRGVVFGDREKRFDDGDPICTSFIMGTREMQGYVVVQTLNSRYVVCDWAGDGGRGSSKAAH
ncbi:hypothetical protein [Pseudomonas sp. BIGb0427]|uniref:hypothetical protein n=1 Tax=Pseudomonas sp. BIGb0427 TaxID=2724470 RepID=UPI001E61710E|nr:hypothetical protein [Pseudomonas sp. BIGb0427]